jgi:hypothetical protein
VEHVVGDALARAGSAPLIIGYARYRADRLCREALRSCCAWKAGSW